LKTQFTSPLLLLTLFSLFTSLQLLAQSSEDKGPVYSDLISFYQEISNTHSNALLLEEGTTDSGKPLHLFLLQKEPIQSSQSLEQLRKNKLVIFINNGIHPGESCGIDASRIWVDDLMANPKSIPEGILIAIIPVYNIGGLLQQRIQTRANQNGPEFQGFRGNAQNLDLNRDFIKSDAKNTASFQSIFRRLEPELFIDTHTSNGADYQYVMTLISTQHNKLAPPLAKLLNDKFEPALYAEMKSRNFEMIPYVNVHGEVPNEGYSAFLETPRYASGYTSLFHNLGFITEAHMLKSYSERVASTLAFLESFLKKASEFKSQIILAIEESREWEISQKYLPIRWEIDSSISRTLDFKGYEYKYIQSELGQYKRLKYLSDKPETFPVSFYPDYKAIDSIILPSYYILPAAFHEVVSRLRNSGVEMSPLKNDSTIEVISTYFREEQFSPQLYEGRLYIKDFKSEERLQERKFYRGDWIISTSSNPRFFLASTLEPQAIDSYLRWGFFSIIFQQKEYFSSYVFEDTAMELLENQPELKLQFEEWKAENSEALNNPYLVLDFIYKHSPYYELEHKRYPVAKIK
jgi:hypothetical protein